MKILICVLSLLLPAMAYAKPPSEQCPQPRFTGRAPDPDYSYTSPLDSNKANLAAGKKIYLGKDGRSGCANCHGKKGEGNGALASQYNPPPRNFACAKTVNSIPDGQLFWIIRNGSPGTGMPPHTEYNDTELWQLILYLRQLASPE